MLGSLAGAIAYVTIKLLSYQWPQNSFWTCKFHPEKAVEVILERYARTDLPDMEKRKFLLPKDMPVRHFIHVLSGRLHLPPGKALFVFVKNTLPRTSSLMNSLYESFKDEDGFLYIFYSSEKTFGCDLSNM